METTMNNPNDRVRQMITTAKEKPAPEQAEPSALARHGDPSTKKPETAAARKDAGLGVEWFRVSDILTGRGQRLADLHASGQERVVKRMRHGMSRIPTSRTATSRRGTAQGSAPNLPPVTAFGTTTGQPSNPAVGR